MMNQLTPEKFRTVHPTIVDLEEVMARYLTPESANTVLLAYKFASEAHIDHRRISGEPFIEHPLAAAITCAELQLDVPVLQAALLHDVVEDCDVETEDLLRAFNPEVVKLVEGVTKLGSLSLPDTKPMHPDVDVQAENLRKMLIAIAEDVRVVIVKLADRLHNMRTLDALRHEKQMRIARETMEIYAPLAARLGIWQIKWELEDLSFQYLEPIQYRRIADQVAARRGSRERYVMQLRRKLEDALTHNGIQAEVTGRVKHIYSIHQKIKKYTTIGKSFNEIYDLLALRILVNNEVDCYKALGVIHGLWRPISGEFDDYIGSPKSSGYQSLHTAVFWTKTRPLEVQIRSFEMDAEAEHGVAAHWRYKQDGNTRTLKDHERLSWLRQVLEWQGENTGPQELVETLKKDIFQDQVFVSTPTGEIIDLPATSTPLDFAFRIHTDVGYSCVAAKVNGRLISLTAPLSNGDVVEIVTSRASRGPSRDWLNPSLGYLKTHHGRTRVRQWFRKRDRKENIIRGREELEKELGRLSLQLAEVQIKLLELAEFSNAEELFASIGSGEITAHHLALRLVSFMEFEQLVDGLENKSNSISLDKKIIRVHALGVPDTYTRFANCCNPISGEFITGYITRNRGITVHRNDCHNILHISEQERLVDVQWGSVPGTRRSVLIRVEGWDRIGFVRDISTVIADEGVNMVGLRTDESEDGRVVVTATVESDGLAHLLVVMHKLDTIRGVLSVGRDP